jgi:hypothetical protein
LTGGVRAVGVALHQACPSFETPHLEPYLPPSEQHQFRGQSVAALYLVY